MVDFNTDDDTDSVWGAAAVNPLAGAFSEKKKKSNRGKTPKPEKQKKPAKPERSFFGRRKDSSPVEEKTSPETQTPVFPASPHDAVSDSGFDFTSGPPILPTAPTVVLPDDLTEPETIMGNQGLPQEQPVVPQTFTEPEIPVPHKSFQLPGAGSSKPESPVQDTPHIEPTFPVKQPPPVIPPIQESLAEPETITEHTSPLISKPDLTAELMVEPVKLDDFDNALTPENELEVIQLTEPSLPTEVPAPQLADMIEIKDYTQLPDHGMVNEPGNGTVNEDIYPVENTTPEHQTVIPKEMEEQSIPDLLTHQDDLTEDITLPAELLEHELSTETPVFLSPITQEGSKNVGTDSILPEIPPATPELSETEEIELDRAEDTIEEQNIKDAPAPLPVATVVEERSKVGKRIPRKPKPSKQPKEPKNRLQKAPKPPRPSKEPRDTKKKETISASTEKQSNRKGLWLGVAAVLAIAVVAVLVALPILTPGPQPTNPVEPTVEPTTPAGQLINPEETENYKAATNPENSLFLTLGNWLGPEHVSSIKSDPAYALLSLFTVYNYAVNSYSNPYYYAGNWTVKDRFGWVGPENYQVPLFTPDLQTSFAGGFDEAVATDAGSRDHTNLKNFMNNYVYIAGTDTGDDKVLFECAENWINCTPPGFENNGLQIQDVKIVDTSPTPEEPSFSVMLKIRMGILYQDPLLATGATYTEYRTYTINAQLEGQLPTTLTGDSYVMRINSLESDYITEIEHDHRFFEQ